MFTEPTVFILGAGASWHYGYPTGEGLVRKVIEKAELLSKYLQNSRNTDNLEWPKFVERSQTNDRPDLRRHWQAALDQCIALKMGLEEVKPLVIDYYLGWNAHLKNIGRLLIAWVILDCERKSLAANGRNLNRTKNDLADSNDDWCRFLIHKLAINCKDSLDLLRKNHVQFVTFNYDVSLEGALRRGLGYIRLFNYEHVQDFVEKDRIFHVYGKLQSPVTDNLSGTNLSWGVEKENSITLQGQALLNHQAQYRQFLDEIYDASLGIRVIDPEDKGADEVALQKAREAIERARFVYILGYGFDENNSRRLGLQKSLFHHGMEKYVHFTNYQNNNRVNKRASSIFFRKLNAIPPDGPSVLQNDPPMMQPFFYERSFRNVYDALERDFESLEAEDGEK